VDRGFRAPLIERLKRAIWAAATHVRIDPREEADDNADPHQSEEKDAE
jgi:hypothetical protein